MAEKAKKDNKNLIIGICVAVLVVVVIAVVAIFASRGNSGVNGGQITDAYFVSDDTKYVLTYDEDLMEDSDEEPAPIKMHQVYTYSGDEITGLSVYVEYADEATAKAVLEANKEAMMEEDVESVSANGKYIVMVMSADAYKDITASEVKEQIDFIEAMKNINFDNEDVEEEDVESIDY